MRRRNRRAFILTGTSLALGATTSSFVSPVGRGPLMHHVFFWLKNPSSKADFEKLIQGIKTLRKIETLREFRMGQPAKTPKRPVIDDTYALSLFTAFSNVDEHNVYQEHPIHKKFIEDYSSLWAKVQVYDSMDI